MAACQFFLKDFSEMNEKDIGTGRSLFLSPPGAFDSGPSHFEHLPVMLVIKAGQRSETKVMPGVGRRGVSLGKFVGGAVFAFVEASRKGFISVQLCSDKGVIAFRGRLTDYLLVNPRAAGLSR